MQSKHHFLILNLLLSMFPFSYHLKIPEKQKIFGVFRECKMGTLAANGLGTSTALVLDLWTLGKKYDIFYISSFPRFLSINKFNL